MIAEKNNELLQLAERLRILEEQGVIDSETIKLTTVISPLPLPQGLAQTLLQEDRELLELRLLEIYIRINDAVVGKRLTGLC